MQPDKMREDQIVRVDWGGGTEILKVGLQMRWGKYHRSACGILLALDGRTGFDGSSCDAAAFCLGGLEGCASLVEKYLLAGFAVRYRSVLGNLSP
jgi:hypothetical protein